MTPEAAVRVPSLLDEVYVTRTGAKYHRGSCTSLRSSKIEMPLAEAATRYDACKICRPPIPTPASPTAPVEPRPSPPASAESAPRSTRCQATTKKGNAVFPLGTGGDELLLAARTVRVWLALVALVLWSVPLSPRGALPEGRWGHRRRHGFCHAGGSLCARAAGGDRLPGERPGLRPTRKAVHLGHGIRQGRGRRGAGRRSLWPAGRTDHVDGEDVSLALVRSGLAWHYTKYSRDPKLAEAENGGESRSWGCGATRLRPRPGSSDGRALRRNPVQAR